jgi:hypothetical protein
MAAIKKSAIVEVTLDTSQYEKNAVKLKGQIQETKFEVEDLNKKLKSKDLGAAEREKLNKQLVQQETKLAVLNDQFNKNKKLVENQAKANEQLEGSYDKLSSQYSANKLKLNALSKEQRFGTEEGKALEAQTLAIKERMNELQEATGNYTGSVGDYEGALKKVLTPLLAQKEALQKNQVELIQQQQELQKSRKVVGGFGTGIIDAAQGLDTFGDSASAVDQQIISNAQALQELEEETERVAIGFKFAWQEQKKMTDGMEENSDEAKENTRSLDSLNDELKKLKEQAKTLDLNSEEYKKTNDAIRETQFEIDKAIGKVDEFGNREPKNPAKEALDDTFDSANAVTDSLDVLNQVTGENAAIQIVQEKALRGVSIAQQVANIAAQKGAILSTLNTVKTKAASIQQGIYTAVVGTSTGALKAFRIALATTGIGVFVIAIGILVAYLIKQRNAQKELTEAQKAYNAAIKEAAIQEDIQITKANALFTALKNTNKGSKERKDLINEINKTYGTTLKNLSDEEAFLKDVAAAQARVIEGIKAKIQAKLQEEKLEQLIRDEQALSDAYQIARNKRIDADETLAFERRKKNNDLAITNARILRDNLIIEQDKARKNYEDNTRQQQIILEQFAAFAIKEGQETDQERENRLKELRDKQRDAANKEKEILQQLYDFERKLNRESTQDRIENIKSQQEREQEALKISYTQLVTSLQQELDAIKTNTKLENSEKTYAQQILDARILELTEKFEKEKKQIQDKYEAEADKKREGFRAKTFERNIIDINKEAELKRLAIEREILDENKKAKALIQLQIDTQQKILAQSKDLFDVDGFIDQEEQDQLDAITTKIIELNDELNKAKKTAPILGDKFIETFNTVANTISGITTTFADSVNSIFNNSKDAIDKVLGEEKKAIENSTLTQKQKQKQIEKLELEAAKKKYEIDVEQFNFNKGVQIVQAIISTASAVVAQFANPVPFAGAILAGIAAATGAAQIGIIAAQQPPPPPFDKGGYTGSGDPRSVSMALGPKDYTYHKDEYVIDHKTLKVPRIANFVSNIIEPTRVGRLSSMGLTGLADGGFTTNAISQSVSSSLANDRLAANIANSIADLQIITKVTDINRVNSNLITTRNQATLR